MNVNGFHFMMQSTYRHSYILLLLGGCFAGITANIGLVLTSDDNNAQCTGCAMGYYLVQLSNETMYTQPDKIQAVSAWFQLWVPMGYPVPLAQLECFQRITSLPPAHNAP